MTLRPLGTTGLQVSPLAIGSGMWKAMLPGEVDISVAESVALTHAVFEHPTIRVLDTSNNYGGGESERRIGIAVRERGGVPDGFLLQTKADRDDSGDFSGQRMRRSLEESMERLGIDHLPMLFLHDPETTTWESAMADGGPVAALVAARDEGLVGHLGVAGGPASLMARFLRTGHFEALITHNRFTLVDRSADDLLTLAHELGVGVYNAAPYGGGLLTRWPRERSWYAYGEAPPALLESVDRIGSLCADFQVPLPAVALQFAMRDPRITSTIVGVRDREQLASTDELARVEVPDQLWAAIDEVPLDVSTWRDPPAAS